jgi:hypothetical protein
MMSQGTCMTLLHASLFNADSETTTVMLRHHIYKLETLGSEHALVTCVHKT